MKDEERTAPNWSGLYAELSGYLQAAVEDGKPVDAADLLVYMAELRIRYVSLTRDQFMLYARRDIFNDGYLTRGNN